MKHRALLVLCLLSISMGINAQNTSCDGTRYKGQVFPSVKKTTVNYARAYTYEDIPAALPDTTLLKMDIYEPLNDTASARPVVILAHGGSFLTGDKNDMKSECERFAKAGYVAATIQYRLFPALILGFPDSSDIVRAVVKAMGDMKAAVRYFRLDASTTNLWKVDSAHIFIGGYSAGAVAALHVGYIDAEDALTAEIEGVIADNGGLEGNSGSAANLAQSSRASAIYNRSGGLKTRDWIDAKGIPLVSIHGTNDETVRYTVGLAAGIAYLEGSGVLHPRAVDQGVDSQLETVEGGDHVNMYITAQHQAQVNNFFATALTKFEEITCATSSTDDFDQVPNMALELMPNPVADVFSVNFVPTSTTATLHIFDAQGRQVRTMTNYQPRQTVRIGDLANGAYSVVLQQGVGVFKSAQFIKQ
jgi:para-nitrobenzyl esterase